MPFQPVHRHSAYLLLSPVVVVAIRSPPAASNSRAGFSVNLRNPSDNHAHQEHCALPDYVEFVPQKPVDLSAVLSAASPDAMDLLLQLLILRPDKRATAAEALRHPYFTKHEPKPCKPAELALPIPEERKNKVHLL